MEAQRKVIQSEVQTLREGLKKFNGSFKLVSKKAGVSNRWVQEVLKGNGDDAKVLLAAAEVWADLVAEEQRTIEAAKETIKNTKALVAAL